MTAEVAVINKSAIALAADSTVTIDLRSADGTMRKTYNTVNKLFTLSKYRPVGVMIYGVADLMGVPWETIIKMYRKHLGNKSFDTLEEYFRDLLHFLEASRGLFPESRQRKTFGSECRKFLRLELLKGLVARVEAETAGGPAISQSRVDELANEVIEAYEAVSSSWNRLDYLPGDFGEQLVRDYATELSSAISSVFKLAKLSEESIKRIHDIIARLYTCDVFPDNLTGLVVAGFGEQEPFPSLRAINIHTIARDRVIYRWDEKYDIDLDTDDSAAIFPFAQDDVVHSFLSGIEPEYAKLIDGMFDDFFNSYPGIVDKHLNETDSSKREELLEKLRQAGEQGLAKCRDRLSSHLSRVHITPLLRVVAMLPKDELASMAGSLVNLTSTKRKMSLEVETVGGPVDVAVISKGDGFIWINRKHYFDPTVNPQFIHNYLER